VAPEREGGAEAAVVSIRKYTSADLAAVLSICRQSPEAAQWSEKGFGQAASSGQLILIAQVATDVSAGARICGFLVARVVAGEAELLNMAVDSAHRRKVLGSKLLAAAAKEAEALQVSRMYLEVRESNQAAISFYERHGFHKNGERAGYYENPTENAVLMEKKLTG
jgi:[ribosomal protein S18]-alanine N-acetyltransferase